LYICCSLGFFRLYLIVNQIQPEKTQRTAYIRWECLIRSLKSSPHNQIQPGKIQRTAYIRWECLIRAVLCIFPGCIWLCSELFKERIKHSHHIYAVLWVFSGCIWLCSELFKERIQPGKIQRTSYIRWECLIRSLKSSQHNQIQPAKKQRTAYIRWECLCIYAVLCFFSGCIWLCSELFKERIKHSHHIYAVLCIFKSSPHNQIQPEKKCCVGYTNIIET
jgi:hypothetical protein